MHLRQSYCWACLVYYLWHPHKYLGQEPSLIQMVTDVSRLHYAYHSRLLLALEWLFFTLHLPLSLPYATLESALFLLQNTLNMNQTVVKAVHWGWETTSFVSHRCSDICLVICDYPWNVDYNVLMYMAHAYSSFYYYFLKWALLLKWVKLNLFHLFSFWSTTSCMEWAIYIFEMSNFATLDKKILIH